jgi:predicted kinase
MELIVFMGIQATGKSSFYCRQFFRTHVRVNLDMLKTRHRERLLLTACLGGKTPLVVDNTNLTRADRGRYIVPAKAASFRVIGYFFESRVADAIRRNALRPVSERVPDKAIPGASNQLELPTFDEGFDRLYFVKTAGDGQFLVEDWKE